MIDITQSNRPLWHQHLTYGQVEAEAEKDYSKVVYNLHEDCLCLCQELAALEQSLAKIRADAIRGMTENVPLFTSCSLEVNEILEYANKIEDES